MNLARLVTLFTSALLTALPLGAQTIDFNATSGSQRVEGTSAGARAGASLHTGDLTGDFFNRELIIGSPGESGNRGTVRIRFGGRLGTTFTTSDVDVILTGANGGDRFGAASDAGHVTRKDVIVVNNVPVDPTPRDLVVAAPDALAGRGVVYLFAGPFVTGERRTTADAKYQVVGHANGHLGTAVETADLTGDGFREIIATEPGTGCVHVVDVHSASGTVLDLAASAPAMSICGAGARIAVSTGDITGDGIFDLAIGAADNEGGRGAVYVFKGRRGVLPANANVNTSADARYVGAEVGDEVGTSVWIGDIDDDSDATEDLIIGAPGADGPANTRVDAGEVYVVFGAVGLPAALVPNLTLFGAQAGHRLGNKVLAGDVTRDGPYEVLALAPGANAGIGTIYTYFGRHRYEFPSSGVVDLATGADRLVVGQAGVGGIENFVTWEANGRGAEEIVAAVPSAATAAGAASGRLYIALSPQVDLSASTLRLSGVQCETPSAAVGISSPSAIRVPWTFYTETPWLRGVPSTGSFAVGAQSEARLVADTRGLAPGTYSGNATIMSRSRDLNMDTVVFVEVTVGASAPTARSATVDFTGDGCGDVGTFHAATGTWHVSGKADVTLGARGDIPVPGDYDGDSIADAAVYRRSNSTWYLSDRAVIWGETGDIPVPGDYDGDGRTDIAVFRPSTMAWLVMGQAPTFFGARGEMPVPADYNGDGRTDMAVYDRTSGAWRIRNQPTVLWGAPFDIPVPADYNGDGRADIAIYRPSTGTWRVKDQFERPFGDSQTFPFALDVNRDGRADLVSYRRRTGVVETLDLTTGMSTRAVMGGPGDLPLTQAWQSAGANSTASDFDGDGTADLIWQQDASRQAVAWYMGGADGNVMQRYRYLTSFDVSGWKIVATADFDRDGTLDLVWQNDVSRQAVVWYMGGPERSVMQSWSWLAPSSVPGWKIVAAADFNGDRIPDLVWQNDATRQASIWFMGGVGGDRWDTWAWLAATDVPGWRIVGVADLNDDGQPDLVWQHDTSRQASVWYLAGPQGNVFTGWNWLNPDIVAGWHIVGINDIDGDGTPDLVWQNDSSRAVTVWIMAGPSGTTMARWAWMSPVDVRGWSAVLR